MNKELTLQKQNKELYVWILIVFGCFLIPTFLEQIINLGKYKQIIIGTLVNTTLFISTINLNSKKSFFLISTLPSLSSILSGLLFAGMTLYSMSLIPFIWLGNFSLIYITKKLYASKNLLFGFISIIIKVIIIYTGFILMSNILNFPNPVKLVLGQSMGIIQLLTASCGLIITLIYEKISNYIEKSRT